MPVPYESQARLPNEGLGARDAVLLAVATRLAHAQRTTRTIQTFNPLNSHLTTLTTQLSTALCPSSPRCQ